MGVQKVRNAQPGLGICVENILHEIDGMHRMAQHGFLHAVRNIGKSQPLV